MARGNSMSDNLNSQIKISEHEFPLSVREAHEIYLDGPNHCVHEIIDNSVDEYKSGVCKHISITIDKDLFVTVADDGRGIPIAPSEKNPEKSMALVALSTLSAGSKFKSSDTSSYNSSTGGKNGVGSSCVNAVSEYFEADITTGGKVYQLKFAKGELTQDLTVIRENVGADKHGTTIIFKLDEEMYPKANYDYNALLKRIQQTAFLNPNLELKVDFDAVDASGNEVKEQTTFCYKNGLDDYMDYLLKNKTKSIETVNKIAKVIENDKRLGRPLTIDGRFTYVESFSSEERGFVNSIPSESGGDHINGFNQGIAKAIRQYGVENKYIKAESDFEINDCLEGLICLIAVDIANPVYGGQNKKALKMSAVASLVSAAVKELFYDFLCKEPKEAKIILNKALRARKERIAVKKAKDDARGIKSLNSKSMTLGKLADCSSKDAKECELFIVEGDSAAGSAKQGRDRRYQAILPIFGKIQNCDKSNMSVKEMIKNVKLGVIIAALRTNIGNDFDINKLRYDKIIIFSDADVDGGHIVCLYITFFYRHMKKIIEDGHLYIACPPLFRMSKGNDVHWAYNDAELKAFTDSHKGYIVNRFKGLEERQALTAFSVLSTGLRIA
jgi:DNA gyrase subunit B